MATIGGFDRQHGFDDVKAPDTYEADRYVAKQEWQSQVAAYEDGLSEVDPGEFEDWF